jgi:hypothetical protein
MTLAQFVARFPEWEEIAEGRPEVIEAALADAAQFVDATAWGSRYDAGLAYKAADLLSKGPFGENARLKADPTKSTYSVAFDEMRAALPMRFLLV